MIGGRRVLITGLSTFWGGRVAQANRFFGGPALNGREGYAGQATAEQVSNPTTPIG